MKLLAITATSSAAIAASHIADIMVVAPEIDAMTLQRSIANFANNVDAALEMVVPQ